jgi:hypothetical protein
MSNDPELERLLAVRDAMLAIYVECMSSAADARDAEANAEDDYFAANSAYDNHEGSLR